LLFFSTNFFNKDTLFIPLITCFSGIVVLLLSYPLINAFSIYGAAILVALGFFITFGIAEVISLSKYGVRSFKFDYLFIYSIIFALFPICYRCLLEVHFLLTYFLA